MDENDLLMRGLLPTDPTEDAEPFTPGPAATTTATEPIIPFTPTFASARFLPKWLPDPLGSFVREVSRSTQTPHDLPALLALAAVSLAVTKRVRFKVHDEWGEPPVLFIAVAMPPSSAKSPVLRFVMAPLIAWEAETQRTEAPDLRLHDTKRTRHENRISELMKRMAKVDDEAEVDALEASLLEEQDRLVALGERHPTRLLAEDATPEVLARLLARHDEYLGLLADEGGIFQILVGRYSGGIPNLDLMKKAWHGGRYTVDRVKGGLCIVLEAPLLVMGLAVQPSVLEQVVHNAALRSTGVVARFLFGLPKPNVGFRRATMTPPAADALDDYNRLLRRLLALPLKRAKDGTLEPSTLMLSPEALDRHEQFWMDIEHRLRPTGDLTHIQDWAGKLRGQVVRLAGLLHLVEQANGGAAALLSTPVSGDAMRRAVRIADAYLIPHAKAVICGIDEDEAAGRLILAWLARHRYGEFNQTDARKELKRAGVEVRLGGALNELAERGYVTKVPTIKSRKGGRPVHLWKVNPAWDWSLP